MNSLEMRFYIKHVKSVLVILNNNPRFLIFVIATLFITAPITFADETDKPLTIILNPDEDDPSIPTDTSVQNEDPAPKDSSSEINIYGTVGKRESESTAPISVISSAEIEAAGCRDAGEAIARLPGNMLNTNGTRGGINSVSIRGSRSSQVAIMVNGRRMNNPLGAGGNDPSKIPAGMIERIEIYRGGASAIQGDGSSGGAINIVTKAPQTDSYQGGYLFDSIDGHDFTFQMGKLLTGKGSSLGFGTELLYNPRDIDIIGGDTVIDNWNASLNLSWIKDVEKYRLSFLNFIQERYSFEEIGNRLHSYSSVHAFDWELKKLKRNHSYYGGGVSFQPYDLRWMPANSEVNDTNTSFSLEMDQRYGLEHKWMDYSLKFSTKMNYRADILKSSSMGLLDRHTFAPVVAVEIKMNKAKREIGIFDFSGRLDGIAGDENLFFPAAAAGFLFYLDNEKKAVFKCSASNSWRAPTLSELYFVTSGYTPPENLTAEKSISFDSGFIFKPKPFIELGLTYFFRREYNSIIWSDNSSINSKQLDFNGVEGWLKMVFILEKGFELSFSGSYLFNDARYSNQTLFDLTHRHIVKSDLVFSYKENVNLTLSGNYYSGFKDIEPFVELNLRARFGYDEYYLLLGIDNLLDKALRFHEYTTPLGRSFSIGLEYKVKKEPKKVGRNESSLDEMSKNKDEGEKSLR